MHDLLLLLLVVGVLLLSNAGKALLGFGLFVCLTGLALLCIVLAWVYFDQHPKELSEIISIVGILSLWVLGAALWQMVKETNNKKIKYFLIKAEVLIDCFFMIAVGFLLSLLIGIPVFLLLSYVAKIGQIPAVALSSILSIAVFFGRLHWMHKGSSMKPLKADMKTL